MKKIIIVTEGQTEQILTRNVLSNLFDLSKISFHCFKLLSGKLEKGRYHDPPKPMIFFQIINIQNDTKVLSYIKENEKRFFEAGFELIIGLRDMYSEEYEKHNHSINYDTINEIKNRYKDSISKMENSSDIIVYFAIMEIEAWFLAMYKIFEKFNSILTYEYIFNKLKLDMKNINPEAIYKPSVVVEKIFSLISKKYNKSCSNIEALTKYISYEDLILGTSKNRCNHLDYFFQKLLSFNMPLIRN